MAVSKQQLMIELKTRGISLTKGQLKQLEKTADNTAKGMAGMAGAIAGATVAIYAASRAFKAVVGTGKEFQQKMADVKAISGATAAEFKKLEQNARALGASTVFTASQVGELQKEYSKLGFTAKEIVQVTKGTLALASAVGADLADAAATAGTTLRGFGLDVSETGRVTDVMALSFSRSALDMQKFTDSMKYVAPIAKLAGVSLEGTTAILGSLANAGIDGSMAGTSLRRILLEAGKAGSKLAKRMGGPITSMEDFQDKLKMLREQGFDPLTEGADLVGKRAVTAFAIMLEGADSTDTLTESLRNAGGAAQEMADVQLDTLEGDLRKLSSATDELQIKMFNLAEESLRNVTQGMIDFINSIDEEDIRAYTASVKILTGMFVLYQLNVLKATIATNGFTMALTRTGIGALVVGVGILVAELIKLSNIFEVTETKADRLAKTTEKISEANEKAANRARTLADAWSGSFDTYDEAIDKYAEIESQIQHLASGLKDAGDDVSMGFILKVRSDIKDLREDQSALELIIANFENMVEVSPVQKDDAPITYTDEQIEQAKEKLEEFLLSETETLETQAIAKLEAKEAEGLELARIAGASELEITKIQESFGKKRQKTRDKFDKAELDADKKQRDNLINAYSAFIGKFLGDEEAAARIQQFKAIVDTYSAANKAYAKAGGWPGGVFPAATSVMYGLANVGMIEKSIQDMRSSKKAQFGMNEIIDSPTNLLVGEGSGPELVQVTPLQDENRFGPEGGGSSVNITFTGNVMSQEFIEDEAIPMIKESLRRGEDIGIS